MIVTERLEIAPATPELTRAALAGKEALQASLRASVPPTWPPEYLDRAALEFTLDRLAEGPGQAGKCGFRPTGGGSEPGVVRFELTRAP